MIKEFNRVSNPNWDDLFEQATVDISTYLWAVEGWFNPPQGYSKDYLLILILSHRSRGRRALKEMAQELPPEYIPHRERLGLLWSKSEEVFEGQILPKRDQLESILRTELVQRLNDLNNGLQEVRHIAQDGDLLGDAEWVHQDLQEAEKGFLLRFQDLALTKEELRQSSLKTTKGYQIFEEGFDKVEQLFKKSFGYFSVIKNTFTALRTREYKFTEIREDIGDFWWLTRTPLSGDVQEEEIPESVIKELQDALRPSGPLKTGPCPEKTEKVIAYALGELDPEENQKVMDHLVQCRGCLDLAVDVFIAEDKKYTVKAPNILPILLELFKFFKIVVTFLIVVPALKKKVLTRGEELPSELMEEDIKRGQILKSGDRFKIKFKIDQETYLYVLHQGTTGKITQLFSGRIDGGIEYVLPEGNNWFQLDEKLGQETIFLIPSKDPIDQLDIKIQELGKIGIDKIRLLFPESSNLLFEFKHE